MDTRGRGFFAGATSLSAALRMLRSHSELWIWCALPVVVNVGTFTLAFLVFWHFLDPLAGRVTELFSTTDPTAWYAWLWVGPLRLLAWLVKWMLIVLFGIAVYFAFTLVGGVLASPFLEVLSRRVERIRTGAVYEQSVAGLGAVLRIAFEEGKRTLFLLGGQLAFVLVGWLPGLQLPALAGALLFTMLFLPLDYTGYLLDRREIPFRTRRGWVWRHRRAMLGFGAASLGTFLIPGLNFLCLPWLVTAGTLLALDVRVPELREVSQTD
jgi:CysZ protein